MNPTYAALILAIVFLFVVAYRAGWFNVAGNHPSTSPGTDAASILAQYNARVEADAYNLGIAREHIRLVENRAKSLRFPHQAPIEPPATEADPKQSPNG